MAKVVATHGARGAAAVELGEILFFKTSYLDFREEACTSYYNWRPRCDICYFSISLSPGSCGLK